MKYLIERWSQEVGWDVHFQQWIECYSIVEVIEHVNALDNYNLGYEHFYTSERIWTEKQKLAAPEVCAVIKSTLEKGATESFAELIKLKFTSGNDIPVDSIRLSREEAQASLKFVCK